MKLKLDKPFSCLLFFSMGASFLLRRLLQFCEVKKFFLRAEVHSMHTHTHTQENTLVHTCTHTSDSFYLQQALTLPSVFPHAGPGDWDHLHIRHLFSGWHDMNQGCHEAATGWSESGLKQRATATPASPLPSSPLPSSPLPSSPLPSSRAHGINGWQTEQGRPRTSRSEKLGKCWVVESRRRHPVSVACGFSLQSNPFLVILTKCNSSNPGEAVI